MKKASLIIIPNGRVLNYKEIKDYFEAVGFCSKISWSERALEYISTSVLDTIGHFYFFRTEDYDLAHVDTYHREG